MYRTTGRTSTTNDDLILVNDDLILVNDDLILVNDERSVRPGHGDDQTSPGPTLLVTPR
jgi:hypothetical protein